MKQILILAALMLVATVGVQAQTLEKVLNKHYAASGVEKIKDIKTFRVNAKASVMGMEMPMTILVKKPNKFKVSVEVMGQKTVSAFDGETGWMLNPMQGTGVQDLKGEQLKQASSQADFEGELYNYAAKGYSAELIGKVNSDGVEAFRIKLTGKDGQVKNYFIDAKTYLLQKMKTKIEAMGQTAELETKILEYQDVKGLKMAKKLEVVMPMGTQAIVMEEIKIDEKIDDSEFTRPTE